MNTPYLQSERHFRLYEHYLSEIVRQWPKVAVFELKPPIASTETLSSRIRIVNKALRANVQSNEALWTTNIPTAKFLQITDEITVSTTLIPGCVVCGPPDMRTEGALFSLHETPVEQTIPKISLVEPELELLLAVLALHHYRILLEPSAITTTQFHTEIEAFRVTHDIGVERVENDYVIV